MGKWELLPYTLLVRIYHLLAHRDRFACSMVCPNWRDALDCPSLWKTLPINLDTDLFDPTISVFMRKYHRYFNDLELRWANNHSRLSWMQQNPNIARRACKFLMVLSETNIQLQSIKFVDWYEGHKLKKMIFHISKFLKNQKSLVNISFFMVNFNKIGCTKLLSCCLECQKTIRNVEMIYCIYPHSNSQEYVILISCLECLNNLKSLKIDYSFFTNGVLEAILLSKTKELSFLEIYVKGYPSFHETVSDSDWEKLKQQNPQLQVAFYFRKYRQSTIELHTYYCLKVEVCHFEEINVVLKEVIPVITISLSCGKMWDQSRSRQYRRTLQLITRYYRKTLENLYIHVKFNREILDDVLIGMFQKCTKLQRFGFSGYVQNLEIVKDLFEMDENKNSTSFCEIRICPKKMDPNTQYCTEKLFEYFSKIKEKRPLNFGISEIHYDKCVVYTYA